MDRAHECNIEWKMWSVERNMCVCAYVWAHVVTCMYGMHGSSRQWIEWSFFSLVWGWVYDRSPMTVSPLMEWVGEAASPVLTHNPSLPSVLPAVLHPEIPQLVQPHLWIQLKVNSAQCRLLLKAGMAFLSSESPPHFGQPSLTGAHHSAFKYSHLW